MPSKAQMLADMLLEAQNRNKELQDKFTAEMQKKNRLIEHLMAYSIFDETPEHDNQKPKKKGRKKK